MGRVKLKLDSRLTRLDPNRLRIGNPQGIDAILFANEAVPIEAAAITELLSLLELKETVEAFAEESPESFDTQPNISRVAVTPDFHKAQGIPVGTVMATEGFMIPQAIGRDINCGMRLHLTDLTSDRVASCLPELKNAARQIFFQGKRNIPMMRQQREALFKYGLEGLIDSTPKTLIEGIWALFHEIDFAHDLDRIESRGVFRAEQIFALDDFLGETDVLNRDDQIGSIGGGNHFVEIQRVEKILDGATAHAWGLKPGMVTVMIHTGSVAVGQLCGGYFRDVVRNIYPKKLRHPENGIFPLPTGERFQKTCELFRDSLGNAANFAFANRLFLALSVLMALRQTCGETGFPLLYDAPHNMLWHDKAGGGEIHIHRKGACPARGFEQMADTPFKYQGEPVLVPGSMGASSFIMVGQGNIASLASASHGAGRAMSRGLAQRGHEQEFQEFLRRFHVVMPVDLDHPDVRHRRDIVDKKLDELRQEAPYAYKGIGPVVETLSSAEIAKPVAELTPILSIKG